jgi:hypothetical protein
VRLDDNSAVSVAINPMKPQAMLARHCASPARPRRQLWGLVLQLPHNKSQFELLLGRPLLPQTRRLRPPGGCARHVALLFNCCAHWHAPLLRCEWLPPLLDKLDRSFGRDLLFCFEVTVTFLAVFFGDWLPLAPGPPADVFSRVDAVLTHRDPAPRLLRPRSYSWTCPARVPRGGR